jgi:hypothetical protein
MWLQVDFGWFMGSLRCVVFAMNASSPSVIKSNTRFGRASPRMGVIGCVMGSCKQSTHSRSPRSSLSLIARIDELKGAWRALGALAPDRLAALRRVATIESIGSSTRIEGSKLSDREFASLQLSSDSISFQSSMPVRYNARTLTRKPIKSGLSGGQP